MDDNEKKDKKIEDLLDLMGHTNASDRELVKKAFDFSKKAHEGQTRASGVPYFFHVFETAKTLAELKMEASVIAAGLLHDVLEDTDISADEIKKEFGEEIFFLIEGVTKLGKLKYRGLKRHTESLRKFFIATSQDIRVLIIRLADRLHNMETLKYLSPEKQVRKSTEVLEIFAPLAYRLGMRIIHRKLEDIAFSYIDPRGYKKTNQLLKQRNKRDTDYLEKFDRSLKKALAKEGITNIKTSFRIKGIYSLHKKLERKKGDIEKIYDITALRIITSSISDCYRILGTIHGVWKPLPGRLKDYIALPKPNGYQSIHTTIFTGNGGIIEIQIRTQKMHNEAEFGIASHIGYKINDPKKALKQLFWVKKLLPAMPKINLKRDGGDSGEEKEIKGIKDIKEAKEIKNNGNDITPGWIKELGDEVENGNGDVKIDELKNDFFEHRVFIFTPVGDVIDLPEGSSAIDFAYAIHSDIGNHLSGAKVNGKLASLDTKLENGDIVEITTKKSCSPTRKWLDMVKTSEAKRNIKSALKIYN